MGIGEVASVVANLMHGQTVPGAPLGVKIVEYSDLCEKVGEESLGEDFRFELHPEGLMAVREHSVATTWRCSYPSLMPGFPDQNITAIYRVKDIGIASLEDFAAGKPFAVHTDRAYIEHQSPGDLFSYAHTFSESCRSLREWQPELEQSFGCFSGETYLRLRDGGVISLAELATMQASGTPLPEVTSFDASTGTFVYQQPVAILTHPRIPSTMMYLQAIGADGASAQWEVTTNHPLLVERADRQDWIDAGDLRAGDRLIGPDGERYEYDAAGTIRVDGVMTVYDVSFGREGLNPNPTQWVSGDGMHWIGAHNKSIF